MKILVSACLLGENCKYNGGNNKNDDVIKLSEKHTLIPVCPEKLAGLAIPREPCEVIDGKVSNKIGEDVTEAFYDGAEKTLYVAEESGCQIAVMKERSPSCGFGKIYDGTFTSKIVNGNGITSDLLYKNGITVIGETQLEKLKDFE
ncbi:MAG: DUF523 domain-containing protein [Eubacterium sp.]